MITFRRRVAGDLPRLHRWLNDPEVVRWWEGDDVSWAGVRQTYGGHPTGPEEHWIALADAMPIGWIQCFRLADVPEDAQFFAPLAPDAGAASIDYLVAAGNRGRGVGSAMIQAFVGDVVFARHPQWTQIWVAPQVANEASWRALAAAGFRHVADLDDPIGPCRAMLLERADMV